MRYAVYVVVVEDTEQEDMRMGEVGEAMDRVAGNLDFDTADLLLQDIRETPGANSDIYRGD